MLKQLLQTCTCLLVTVFLLCGCECSHSSKNTRYSPYQIKKADSDKQMQEIKYEIEQAIQSFKKPNKQRIQNNVDWENGYYSGWEVGYHDAINGNGAWASYGNYRAGDFKDGYDSGYIDGYENGKQKRSEKNNEIEDL